MSASATVDAFGAHLRHWRGLRRHSQLSLSIEADISSRHLSFLESGRARPSREMVLRLADALAMPKEAANQALNAAGFAPVFPALNADAPALAPVRRAVEIMLARHDPFPGIAIDRRWNVIAANKSAMFLFAQNATPPAGKTPNLIDALIDAESASFIENWNEIACLTIARLRAETIALGGDEHLSLQIKTLEALLANRADGADTPDYSRAVIPTIFSINDVRLTLFSTIASFSTVQDVAASDIRIELMFPEDEDTRAFFEEACR